MKLLLVKFTSVGSALNTKVSQILRQVPGMCQHSASVCQISECCFQFIFTDRLSEGLCSDKDNVDVCASELKS